MERYKTCKTAFVAETEDGEIAGFCNGCCADTDYLADALYHDATLHNPDGDYQMIFGLDVNPKFQKQGIGEALMRHMVKAQESVTKSRCSYVQGSYDSILQKDRIRIYRTFRLDAWRCKMA